MTRSRTETRVVIAVSLSATAVTRSTMLVLPAAMAWAWVSDLRPASTAAPSASLTSAPKLGPPAPSSTVFDSAAPESARRASLAYAPAAAMGVGMAGLSGSGGEDRDGALDHAARCGDDVDVRLIGALGVAHVG